MKKVNEFLKKCDIDCGEVGVQETIEFKMECKCTTIEEIKKYLTEAFGQCGMSMLHIEGGAIE